MDGHGRQTVVDRDVEWVNGIAIDFEGWQFSVQAIRCINFSIGSTYKHIDM